MQTAGVAEQDQRCRFGSGSGRPQDAGDLAEGEFAFDDAVIETLFRSESHGRAFRSAVERRSRTTYRPTATPERSTHVDTFIGYHLLVLLRPPEDYQGPSRNRRGNLLRLIDMSVKVGLADRRLTFGENTRHEYRPAWSVRGDLTSCRWQG